MKVWTYSYCRKSYGRRMIANRLLAKRILSPTPYHLPLSPIAFSRFSSSSPSSGPTFSSTGNPKNLVTKLGPRRLFNLLWNGKLHSPMPKQYNLVPKEFIPAAVEAVAMVTKTARERDWEGLEGLVQQSCIQGIRDQVDSMSEEERKLIVVHPEDAFLLFISNESSCGGGKDVNLVVFFYPDLHTIKHTAEQMNQLKKETDEKIQKDIAQGNIKNTTDLKGEFVDFKEKLREMNVERGDLFKRNGIFWCGMVGNYRLVRESLDGEWAISAVGQADSTKVMAQLVRWELSRSGHLIGRMTNPFLRFRYKVLLGKSILNGLPFKTVLRRDLWVHLFIVLFSLWLSIATSGTMTL